MRHPEREALRSFLAEKGVETLIHYSYLLHEQQVFRSAAQKSLPLYPKLENAEIETVHDAVGKLENRSKSTFSHDASG